MSLDLKLVESFVTVAETLNFSVAAERSNTVQSAISAHIRQLEIQVNRPLVERGRGKRVALTKEGTAFLVQARRLLAFADEIALSPGRAVDTPPLRLGTSVTFALSVVPGALAAFSKEDGAAPVTVRTARSHQLMELLDNDEIDVAMVYDQGVHAARRWTIETELSWVATENLAKTIGGVLPLAFLEDARDLRRHAFAALDQSGKFNTSLTTHHDPIGMRAVVTAGLAVTVLPGIAVVTPLFDVGRQFGLPQLATLPISIYAAPGNAEERKKALSDCLRSALESRR
ncbi:LysR family transcriptional regulator [Nitratireductor sp. XY-223]|uniref:LysR family transcriptional regulator n=1 Tax=Nitratireductor sp. XY-223 TaxID=2561926 RepID=UPI0010A9FFA9|nr:LysR family transcriptional regulator [Nitratireductor sp. XY-223]